MVNKRGKIWLIVGIVVVILIILGVVGLIIYRNAKCSNIQIPIQINGKSPCETYLGLCDEYGVNCMGEKGQEVKLGTGGRRGVICMIKTNETSYYDLRVVNISSLKGASTQEVQKWILDEGWKGDVSPGGDGEVAPVLILDIPRDAPATKLKITIEEINENDVSKIIHTSYVEVVPASFLDNILCK